MTVKANEKLDRNKLKEQVIVEACGAFRKYGIKRVTMDEIASLLTISKRTLYEIFEDKEALLIAIIQHNREKNRQYTERAYSESANVLEVVMKVLTISLRELQVTNRNLFADLKKYPKAYNILLENRKNESNKKIHFFKLGAEQGYFRTDLNFEILSDLLEEQWLLFMRSDICTQFSFVEIFEAITFTFLRGISTQKGTALLEDFLSEYRENGMPAVDSDIKCTNTNL